MQSVNHRSQGLVCYILNILIRYTEKKTIEIKRKKLKFKKKKTIYS